DDLVLGRSIVAKLRHDARPKLVHRAPSVHQPDEQVDGRRESVKAARNVVLDHIPSVSAIAVSMHLHVTAQTRTQLGNTIPVLAEKRLGHGALTATTSTA